MNELNSAFRGAVDLSTLANKVLQEKLQSTSTVKVDNGQIIKVPSLSVEISEANLRAVLEISSKVAVVISFYSQTDAESISLTNKLEELVLESKGSWLLGKLDMSSNQQLVEAFGVLEPATVAMILKGEPKPLFQGDQPKEALADFIKKLVDVAASQGLSGQLEVAGAEEPVSEPKLSQAEQAALDAMDRGDFSAAVAIYQDELKKSPGNDVLVERLAQVKLVERTFNKDMEKELKVEPSNVAEAMVKADCLLAIGDADSAFNLLLTWFDKAKPEERSALSSLLLELFNVVGKTHSSAIEARKSLAAKMF